jgi:hypothetical protein
MEKVMATDDKKSKSDPVPKKEPAPKTDAVATDKSTPDAAPAKAEGGETTASYSRGEGQKPVTRAYKDNWNVIFGKKEPKKKTKKTPNKEAKKKTKKKAKKKTKQMAKKPTKKRTTKDSRKRKTKKR